MKILSLNQVILSAVLMTFTSVLYADTATRWPEEKANTWYAEQNWSVGANFNPSSAINQLEMWQKETFDPETINRELGYAASIGMNIMRVYLHDIPWQQDSEAYLKRMEKYLEIADGHGIKTMFVIFDSVWHPHPKAGIQPEPVKGVHNSGWVQSPGIDILNDSVKQNTLKPYVQGVIKHFRTDIRVLVWDLFNEPDNNNFASYGPESKTPDLDMKTKNERASELINKTFNWAREVNPEQPLTVGVWLGARWDKPRGIAKLSLELSDIITFHSYSDSISTEKKIKELLTYNRPLFCTEYMARPHSTFQDILPLFKKYKIGAVNWGLVNGKSNTIYPWHSWKEPFDAEPEPWFHDVFRKDGTPFSKEETDLIKELTEK